MVEVSVLIPTYNDRVLTQVTRLQAQLAALASTCALSYEVIVADDCSTNLAVRQENECLMALPHCRLVSLRSNVGRAGVRNRLAEEACYPWLIYIDAALWIPDGFVGNYLWHVGKAQVVCGGSTVDAQSSPQGLRYVYESSSAPRFSASERQRNPYRAFRTNNFMIAREVMMAHPLRADIRTYGYEDVLFGKELARHEVSIAHIDNPVIYRLLEDNATYLHKVEESLRTLHAYRDELNGYSPLLQGVEWLQKWRVAGAMRLLYQLFGSLVRRNLMGGHPSLLLFKVFKVGAYLQVRLRCG